MADGRRWRHFAAQACAVALVCSAAGPAGAAEPAAAALAPEPARWSLGEVMSIAVANHPLVGRADAGVRAAAARSGQAGSARLPQVAATAGLAWSEAPTGMAGGQERSLASSVQGSVSQLLTDFGRTRANLARAADLEGAAGQNARGARVEVAYGAQVAYLDVLRADSVLEVRRETVRQREALQRQAQAFFDAGLRARIDVVRAEANLHQARADAASAGFEARTARLVLLERMGLEGPVQFELEALPAALEAAGTVEEWLREADDHHPDLLAARLQARAARAAAAAAARGDNPVLTASGRLGWAGEDLPEDRSWSVGAQLTVPLFDGRLARHREAEARADLVAAELSLAGLRRQVRLAVEQAHQALLESAERLAVRGKEREAFAENLRLATGRYEAGAADIIEMVDAQVQMTVAETSLVQARFDRAAALAVLYRALGRFPQAGN